jgi:hypothetical protein
MGYLQPGETYITTWINVIYQIQWHPRAKKMVIHLDGLAPFQVALKREQGNGKQQCLVVCNLGGL